MSFSGESGHSFGSYLPHESTTPTDYAESMRSYQNSVISEQALVVEAFMPFRLTGMRPIDHLDSNYVESIAEGVEFAAVRPILETGVLLNKYNSLLFHSQQFPYLYRFLRTLEAEGVHRRGGYSLLVGSGATIPEYLANYIAVPTTQDIDDLFQSYDEEFLVNRANDLADELDEGRIPRYNTSLLDGMAMAIESSNRMLSHVDRLAQQYGVDWSRLHMRPYTLGDVINNGEVPKGLDSIIWHRADPKIVASSSGDVDYESLNKLITYFIDHLAPGGSLIVTVGTGNSNEEQDKRVNLVRQTRSMLGNQPNVEVWKRGPEFYVDHPTEVIFGNPRIGIISAAVGKKAA